MKRIELNGTYGYEDFITDEEQKELLTWTNDNIHQFISNKTGSSLINGPYGSRKIGVLRRIENSPLELVKKIKDRVIEVEQIKNWKEVSDYDDAIGINEEGSSIHIHTDPNDTDFVHVRYNIILSYPLEGGHSIYNGKINVLKEKLAWKCVSGKVEHGSTPVKGNKPRVTLTLGFSIPEIQKIKKTLL